MTRALVNNMVAGVTKGFEKKLEIQASAGTPPCKDRKLTLNIGYNKPVQIEVPKGHHGRGARSHEPRHLRRRQAGGRTPRRSRSASAARRSRTRARACRYKDEVVRRKAGKSFGS
jgi:large subunit ribosomal protein L6